MLGFALRAAGASEDTAPPDERAEAWANLQRLRHLLEGSQGGAEAVPADILVRTLELIGGFIHGTRKMNKDVDADAVVVVVVNEDEDEDEDVVGGANSAESADGKRQTRIEVRPSIASSNGRWRSATHDVSSARVW